MRLQLSCFVALCLSINLLASCGLTQEKIKIDEINTAVDEMSCSIKYTVATATACREQVHIANIADLSRIEHQNRAVSSFVHHVSKMRKGHASELVQI